MKSPPKIGANASRSALSRPNIRSGPRQHPKIPGIAPARQQAIQLAEKGSSRLTATKSCRGKRAANIPLPIENEIISLKASPRITLAPRPRPSGARARPRPRSPGPRSPGGSPRSAACSRLGRGTRAHSPRGVFAPVTRVTFLTRDVHRSPAGADPTAGPAAGQGRRNPGQGPRKPDTWLIYTYKVLSPRCYAGEAGRHGVVNDFAGLARQLVLTGVGRLGPALRCPNVMC